MVLIAGDQAVADADLKDTQHAEDVDLLGAVRLMDAKQVKDQHVHQQHDEPCQRHTGEQGDALRRAASRFPEEENQPCHNGQDDPGIQQVESGALGISAGDDGQLRIIRLRAVYQVMEVIGQHHNRQEHRGDQQQTLVPFCTRPGTAPGSASAGSSRHICCTCLLPPRRQRRPRSGC